MENNNKNELLEQENELSSQHANKPKPQQITVTKNNKFFNLMVVVALGLSGFTIYKMYEPVLYDQGFLDAQQQPEYVTVEEFRAYQNLNKETLEQLHKELNILRDQPKIVFSIENLPEDQQELAKVVEGVLTNFQTDLYTYLEQRINHGSALPPAPPMEQPGVPAAPAEGEATVPAPQEGEQAQVPAAPGQTPEAAPAPDAQTPTAEQPQLAAGAPTEGNQEGNLSGVPVVDQNAVRALFQELVTAPEYQNYIVQVVLGSDEFQKYAHRGLRPGMGQELNGQGLNPEALNPFNPTPAVPATPAVPNAPTTSEQVATPAPTQDNGAAQELADLKAQLETQTQNLTQVTTDFNNYKLTLDETVTGINGKLDAALANLEQTTKEREQVLTELITKASNLLVQQALYSAQTLITKGASLDDVMLHLELARVMAVDPKAQEAIAADMQALYGEDGKVTNAETATYISDLILHIDELPSILDALGTEQVTAQEEPQGFWATLGHQLFSFVSVSKVTDNALADKNANLYVHENLKLQLQSALLAAQLGNDRIYQNSLQAAIKALENYFDNNVAQVRELKETLQSLAALNFVYDPKYELTSTKVIETFEVADDPDATVEPTAPEQSQAPASEQPATPGTGEGVVPAEQSPEQPAAPADPATPAQPAQPATPAPAQPATPAAKPTVPGAHVKYRVTPTASLTLEKFSL